MRRFMMSALCFLYFASPAAAENAKQERHSIQKLTFTNKEIDGKKVWLPGEASISHEGKVEITLINELKDPHGFSAPGLTKEPLVVLGGQTKSVEIDAKAGEYKFVCHLHPAHVGGTIAVNSKLTGK